MIGRTPSIVACAIFLIATVSCSKHVSEPQLVIEVPADFRGNFVVEMGVRGAAPLKKLEGTYVVAVSRAGKVITSTYLDKPRVAFKNAGDGRIWGYSQSVFNTGDGITIGGKIEFFVGTQKEYEAEQGKKNHSGGRATAESILSGV
jgi:hypothetical protein